MKKKLLLLFLSVTLIFSLSFAAVNVWAAEETKTPWSGLSNGEYNGETYNNPNPGGDYYLGTDADGNLFFETVNANHFAAYPQTEYFVDGFKIDFKIAPQAGSSFNEGQTYYVGLGTTEMGILNALKLVYTNGAFQLYAIAAGLNPDNGGAALSDAEGTIRIAAGETVSYRLVADEAQENLDVYVNDYKTFTSPHYPCFASSAAHVYYNRNGAYKGKIIVYDGLYDAVASTPNRITVLGIQDGEFNRTETISSAAATIIDNKWSYEGVLYAPNNEFFVGRDKKNNLFYQTHATAHLNYVAISDALYYANGFKTTFSFDLFDGQTFTDGYYYIIGLSNAPMAMPMVSVKFAYESGKGFKATYVTAGLNAECDLNVDGTLMYVQAGEKTTLEFKEENGGLAVYLNGVKGHTTARYPAHENAAYTLPQNGLGQYAGYLAMDVNYWHSNGTTVGNRVTFYELPERITGKKVAPVASELNGTLDASLTYFDNFKTWSMLSGNLQTAKHGTINYANPSADFWMGETEAGALVYESEGAGAFNALSDLKLKVDGYKISFMVQNKGTLTVGSRMFIGLSNAKQGYTMAAIELRWTGRYFEMRYSSAGLLNYDGNELSSYGNIGYLWLGQRVTFEYKANEEGGLDIIVNGEKAFTTMYYPSFQGNADYTFPQENGEYVGYFSVLNGTVSSPVVVASRLTIFELSSSSTGAIDPPEDPKETEPEGLNKTIDENVTLKTFGGSDGTLETEKYGGINFKNNIAGNMAAGVDGNGNLIVQSAGTKGYGFLTSSKAYADGFKMSFMIQMLGDAVLPSGYAIQIGLSNMAHGMTMAAIELKWTGKYFEMKYSSAAIFNYDGKELSSYGDNITHMWLGQTMTFEYKANANGGLDIYVNGIYTFTTGYYPSFNNLSDYTLPSDENGKVYGYFSIHDGTYPESTSAEHRITFSELSLEYASGDDDYDYEVIETIAATATETTRVHGTPCSFEGVNYTSSLGENYKIGRDVNEKLYYQSADQRPFVALTDKKVYADGMKYSFMVQKIGESELADGSYFFIGISESKNGNPMVSVYLVWNAEKQVFEMYYRAAGLTNGDGGRFSTYNADLHNLHLGEKATVQFRQESNGTLALYMNDIYMFSTGTYPSFPGASQYTLPSDNYGYYGYLAVLYCAGLPQVSNTCDVRLTFFDIVTNGFASGNETVYDADDETTYAEGTSIGRITEDFVYSTLKSGAGKDNVMYASGANGAFSFRYNQTAIFNAIGFAFNAVHESAKDAPVYSFYFIDKADATNYIKVSFKKSGGNKATVYADGEEMGTINFDWVNANATSIVNVGLFVNRENLVLQIGSAVYELSAETFAKIKGFSTDVNGNIEGYLEIANETGKSAIVISNLVTDGTAVQKKVAKAIVTTIANVDMPFGTDFVNTYNTVEVLFYDGTKEKWNVTWDESAINKNFAAPYVVTGVFENITDNYYFSEEIKAKLSFTVNVGYPDGFYKYGTSDYDNQADSIWFNCGGGANDFIYRNNGDGTHTIISDGYKGGQFMPASVDYRDIDGYTFTYTQKLIKGESGLFIFLLMPEPKHPVEFGTPVIGLALRVSSGGAMSISFFGGNDVAAYLKDENGNVTGILETGAFDGVSIRTQIVEGNTRYVKFFVSVGDKEYSLVNADGSDYTDNGNRLDNFTNDRMYVCLWNEVGYSSYTFKEDYTLYVVDYEKPEDRVVSFGSEHGLPTEIELTLNDGSKVTGTITWTGEYNKELAGTYRLEGIISYNGAIGNGSTIFDGIGDKITATVTVRDEIKIIKNFTKVADVRIKVGDEYSDKLATTFVLSVYSEYYKTTQEITVQILWSGKVNVLVPGTYTLTATPVGAYRFDENIDENILKVNVIVEETSSGSSSSDDESGCLSAASGAGLMSVIVLGMALVAFKKRKNNN